jgi:galactokinase
MHGGCAQSPPMTGGRIARAFAPGRVNLIGEHTDYNGGLALPVAVTMGVTVTAVLGTAVTAADPPFVRGAFRELRGMGLPLPDAQVAMVSDLPARAGLSSSAAVCVGCVMALMALVDAPPLTALKLARLCQRIEHALGLQSGLLDQLAVILGQEGEATLIDFSSYETRQVPFDVGGACLVLLDSGAARELAKSGYNQRREECQRGMPSRLRHVTSENDRVLAFVDAMGDPVAMGGLLDESHASLRDDFEVSTPAVERTVQRAKRSGAFGARIMGGGFGGSVLALFPGDVELPADAVEVLPARGARVL